MDRTARSNNGGSNTTPKSTTPSAPTVPADLPKIRHVFEIALSTTSYASAFGPSSNAAYLRSLVPKGTLLSGFHSLGSGELADNLALVSGQGPDPDTAAGCTKYAEFPTGVTAKSNGLVAGNGCVYPETALTIGDQVSASGHVWKAYIADMGKQRARTRTRTPPPTVTCRAPRRAMTRPTTRSSTSTRCWTWATAPPTIRI